MDEERIRKNKKIVEDVIVDYVSRCKNIKNVKLFYANLVKQLRKKCTYGYTISFNDYRLLIINNKY
jgi:GTP1/Obg family GTP-binding protein